jgi:hypothetical protein
VIRDTIRKGDCLREPDGHVRIVSNPNNRGWVEVVGTGHRGLVPRATVLMHWSRVDTRTGALR